MQNGRSRSFFRSPSTYDRGPMVPPKKIALAAEIFASSRDFRWQPRFSPAAEIFAGGQDFHGRSRFSRVAELFQFLPPPPQRRGLVGPCRQGPAAAAAAAKTVERRNERTFKICCDQNGTTGPVVNRLINRSIDELIDRRIR